MWAVEITELTKDYRLGFWSKKHKRALDRLSLAVDRGEVFGLLGPNGAGKTTLMKLLLRLTFPTAGSASILGRPLGDVRAHARLGYLPENPYFYDHLTAAEFLNYAGWLCGLDAAERRRRCRELLERVGLVASATVPMRRFSKGMVQRLGIAQALVNDPEVIFLDEPMSGLDPLGRRQVRDLILDLRRNGKTIFFSTHILPDAEALCDRVAVLNGGRLQDLGNLQEILRSSVESIELVLHDPPQQALEALAVFHPTSTRNGNSVRFALPASADVNAVLNAALAAGARVVSLNPVKLFSLEDYFLSRVQARVQESAAGSAEGSARGAEADRG